MPWVVNHTISLGSVYCKVLSITRKSLSSSVKMYKNVYLRVLKNMVMCMFTHITHEDIPKVWK